MSIYMYVHIVLHTMTRSYFTFLVLKFSKFQFPLNITLSGVNQIFSYPDHIKLLQDLGFSSKLGGILTRSGWLDSL